MPRTTPPPGHTPLVALPVVSLDLETTGLDVTRDRVVQIGLVDLDGERLAENSAFETRIDPEIPMPAPAARITGLSDEDLAGAPRLAEILPDLAGRLSGRVLIGHHIAFDLAILRNEAARLGIVWRDPPCLDLAHLLAGLEPRLADLGFESVLGYLGVAIRGRHDALGDATMAAEGYQRLCPMLVKAGIRTLAEAQALTDRRPELRRREIEAGWHGGAGAEGPSGGTAPAPGRLDGIVFARRLREVMSAPPVHAAPQTSVTDAAATMIERRIGALLVGEPSLAPVGIVTERDLLKSLLADRRTGAAEATVAEIMSQPVESLGEDEFVYRALGRMDRLAVRHLAVTRPDGSAAGIISQRDLLMHRGRSEALIKDAVDTAASDADLAAAFAQVPAAADGLLQDGLDGLAIAGVVSRELRAATAQAAALALTRLAEDGQGSPPAPWCLLVLGSGGRGESLLGADQDNALVHGGSPEDDPWFAAFGAWIADSLDLAGVPRCTGGVMAANAEWRGTREDWRARVGHWLSRARPEDLLNIDIFFDMVPVAGAPELADGIRREAVAAASRNPPFLGLLARSLSGIVPRLGLFGGLPVEDGRFDVKRNGLLPLVSLARSLALADGIDAVSTPGRLAAVAERGRLGRADVEGLAELHRILMTALVGQQLRDLEAGIKVSNRVAAAALSKRDTTAIRDGLKRLAGIIGDIHGLMAR
jgi:signal-transduction protein with cAMP-binding, CBS, and nucleotidyltransferase domain/DNA polymerase III epsilon subunit-like protein